MLFRSDTITYSPEAVSNATVNRTFGLFPNPASDKLLIHGVNLEGSYQLRITDVAGRKVKEVPIHFSNQTSSVSVKDFAKGPYIALLIDENNRIIFSAPFVKE